MSALLFVHFLAGGVVYLTIYDDIELLLYQHFLYTLVSFAEGCLRIGRRLFAVGDGYRKAAFAFRPRGREGIGRAQQVRQGACLVVYQVYPLYPFCRTVFGQ